MKKIIAFLLALSFCIIFSACGGEKQPEPVDFSGVTFETGELSGMTYEVPDTWRQTEGDPGLSTYYYPKYDEMSLMYILISPFSGTETFDSEKEQERFISSLAEGIDDYKKVTTENRDIDGEPGFHHACTGIVSDNEMDFHFYAVTNNNYVISFSAGIESKADDETKKEFSALSEHVIDSVDLSAFSPVEESEPTPTPTVSAPVETAAAAETKTEYNIGETWTVDGQWSLTITGVQATTDRNRYSDKEPAAVYIVDYTYENLGYEGSEIMPGLYINLEMGTIIDSAKKLGYSYPGRTSKNPSEIPVGVSCDAQACIGVDNAGSFSIMISKYDGNNQRQEATFNLAVD